MLSFYMLFVYLHPVSCCCLDLYPLTSPGGACRRVRPGAAVFESYQGGESIPSSFSASGQTERTLITPRPLPLSHLPLYTHTLFSPPDIIRCKRLKTKWIEGRKKVKAVLLRCLSGRKRKWCVLFCFVCVYLWCVPCSRDRVAAARH